MGHPAPDILSQSKEALKETLASCYASLPVFCKTLFPDRFSLPFSGLHQQLFDVIESDAQQVVIAAPRGFGKSTIDNLALPARNILFRDKKFIVPISCTATQAVLQGEDLKAELLSNPLIQQLFGPMKSGTFAKDLWVTETGTMVMPRGAGQQVRGIRHRGARPDLIIVDDLEDSEEVLNEENRKKLKHWFFSDVVNSVDRSRDDWKIVVVGTVLHEDSLLENLLNDPDWKSVRLSLCDDDYKSCWPDFMNDEGVRRLVEAYRSKGMLDVFYREYRNMPISREDAIFRQEYLKHYKETDKEFTDRLDRGKIETLILIDPAKTVKLHSAHSAILAVGIDVEHGSIYVREVVADTLYPDQLYATALSMAQRYKARAIGLEVTSLNEFITFPFKNEMVKRGVVRPLIELKARDKKENRIAMLVPFYRSGHVFHNETCCAVLEEQLMTFPRCKRFDIIDALAYVIEMMDAGNRFFEGEHASEDEYAELRDEKLPQLKQFRVI